MYLFYGRKGRASDDNINHLKIEVSDSNSTSSNTLRGKVYFFITSIPQNLTNNFQSIARKMYLPEIQFLKNK